MPPPKVQQLMIKQVLKRVQNTCRSGFGLSVIFYSPLVYEMQPGIIFGGGYRLLSDTLIVRSGGEKIQYESFIEP